MTGGDGGGLEAVQINFPTPFGIQVAVGSLHGAFEVPRTCQVAVFWRCPGDLNSEEGSADPW